MSFKPGDMVEIYRERCGKPQYVGRIGTVASFPYQHADICVDNKEVTVVNVTGISNDVLWADIRCLRKIEPPDFDNERRKEHEEPTKQAKCTDTSCLD